MRGCVGSGGAAKSLIRTKVNLERMEVISIGVGHPGRQGARRVLPPRKNLRYVSILKKSDG